MAGRWCERSVLGCVGHGFDGGDVVPSHERSEGGRRVEYQLIKWSKEPAVGEKMGTRHGHSWPDWTIQYVEGLLRYLEDLPSR